MLNQDNNNQLNFELRNKVVHEQYRAKEKVFS